MNCPGCGAPVEADQQFCRACGTALADDASSLIHPRTVVLISVLMIFLGIIVGVTGGIAQLSWLKYTGIYIALFGFVALVGGSLILERITELRTKWRIADEKAKRRRSQQPTGSLTIERADTTKKLLPDANEDFIPAPPSIVEHSTELLKQPSRKK